MDFITPSPEPPGMEAEDTEDGKPSEDQIYEGLVDWGHGLIVNLSVINVK